MISPNVVLIFADDLGYGDISCLNKNSKINTVNIDALASESMKYTDMHASSSLCTPSRYGLMTGRYNWRSKLKYSVISGGKEHLIEDGRLTMGLLFKKAGYNTACVGKWHLGLDWTLKDDSEKELTIINGSGLGPDPCIDYSGKVLNGPPAFGFDYSYVTPGSLDIPPYVFVENGFVTAPPNRKTGIPDFRKKSMKKTPEAKEIVMSEWPEGDTSTDFDMMQVVPDTAERVLNLIDRYCEDDKPFFIYYPIHAPHTPCIPTPDFAGKSEIGPYGDMVLMIDSIVGRIIGRLKDNEVYDDTILIFTSDNGSCQNFPEQGHRSSYIYRGMKSDIWDGGHRIPFIVRYPEIIKANTICVHTACLTDLLATFAEMLNIKLSDNEAEDSLSNLDQWQGSEETIRDSTIHSSGHGYFAIRKGKWKLIMCPGSGGWSPDPVPKDGEVLPPIQLYDMETDVREENNVWKENPDIVMELTNELTTYVFSGRSTPGTPQRNTGPNHWEQINWLTDE